MATKRPHIVGLGRFELPTSCPPDKRANQAAPQPVATASSVYKWRDDPPAEIQNEHRHQQLEMPWRFFAAHLRELPQRRSFVGRRPRRRLCRSPARGTVTLRRQRRRSEVARARFTPGHAVRVCPYPCSERVLTRSLIGVEPNSNASRIDRSRYRRYDCGSSRLTNSVNVGGSTAPCNAYRTRAP